MDEPEAKIMADVAEGNLSAFRKIVELYQNSLVHFITRFIGDKTEAEDIAQEVFLKVFKAAGDYRPKSKFKTWLFKIATNHCLNAIRDGKKNPDMRGLFELNEAGFLAIAPDTYSPLRILEGREIGNAVRDAIGKLPHNQRTALLLREFSGFSYGEISHIMGCSVSAVESLIQRARQNLRKMLSSYL